MTCEPLLFHTSESVLAALAGVTDPESLPAAVVVDWERRDKERRQARLGWRSAWSRASATTTTRPGARTTAPAAGAGDLPRRRPTDLDGVDVALAGGAAEVLLPMVRHEDEVDRVLERAAGRIRVGIMLETRDAVDRVDLLVARPLSRAYLGLVDLALDRGTPSIFSASRTASSTTSRSTWRDAPRSGSAA